MKLTEHDARMRLAAQVHGVMCTLHPVRGPDPIPAVYAVDDEGYIGVPVDRVKPKTSTRLQREDNLDRDDRAALLVEHWDAEDWTRLWWVRAELQHVNNPPTGVIERLTDRLADTVPQYADKPFERVIICRVIAVTGWSAQG